MRKQFWKFILKPTLQYARDKLLVGLVPDQRVARYYYWRATGKRLHLDAPVNYSEKLWWLILNNRDPLLRQCTDKLSVREYVRSVGLGYILNELYGVYGSPDDISFEKLPERAFLKTTHGSGGNALWDASAPFDIPMFRARFKIALSQNFYFRKREWNYDGIAPRIIAEKYLAFDGPLIDYRLLCFHGEFKLAFVDAGTAASDGSHASHAVRNVHDRDFNILPVKAHREAYSTPVVPRPDNWEEMIEIAEKLSKPFAHCRVDLYNNGKDIIFGEMTFYPGGGSQPIEPEEFHELVGSWIDLNRDVTLAPARK